MFQFEMPGDGVGHYVFSLLPDRAGSGSILHRFQPTAFKGAGYLLNRLRGGKWPGLETCDLPYAKRRGPRNHNHNHNLERLIDWSQLPVLDAGLRFRNHPFAQLDDENLTKMIDEPLKVLCMEVKPRNWMVEATYADYPLRDKEDAQQTWRFNYQEGVYERFEPNKQGDRFIDRSDLVKERPKISINAWLCWTREELAEEARNAGISLDEAFRFSIRGAEDKEFEWDEAFGACPLLAA